MGNEMTWEQKFQALQSIADICLHMRKPGDWYVSMKAEIHEAFFLVSSYGKGTTPQEAIEDHWRKFSNLPYDNYVVVKAGTPERKALRWNNFMWQTVEEEPEAPDGQ